MVKKIIIGLAVLIGCLFAVPVTMPTFGEAQATVIGGRPSGCPARYCGCATARKVGLSGSFWNLAANYKVLPRASCAPGMVAARRGHVFVIQSCNGNGTVTAWDPNSGGGKTRIHTRSLAGYTVHNPHGGNALARYGRSTKVARASAPQQFAWWQPWPHRVLDQQDVTSRRTYRGKRHYRSQQYYSARRSPSTRRVASR